MRYILFIFCGLYISSCKVCEKRYSRTPARIEKKNLVCSCYSLQTNASLETKMHSVEKSTSIYFFGEVITTKDKKGIYQYIKSGTGIRGNMFMYYNGSTVKLVNNDNLSDFADSLRVLGVNNGKINKKIPAIRKSLAVPPENTTDSF